MGLNAPSHFKASPAGFLSGGTPSARSAAPAVKRGEHSTSNIQHSTSNVPCRSRHWMLNVFSLFQKTVMPFGNSEAESQRDSILQPRVARDELPWVAVAKDFNPNGVASPRIQQSVATPLGLWCIETVSLGSSFLATLGCMIKSRWDCNAGNSSATFSLPSHLF